MANDLTVRQESGGYIIPTNLGEVVQMANAVCRTAMCPNQFRGKPEETAAAMLYCIEQGLPPITGLRFVAIINGVNSLFGDAVPGVAMRKRLIKHMREWTEGAGDQFTAYCEVERPDGSKVLQKFSVADAKAAKLWGKAGPWAQYANRMLQMRARSWAVRDAAPHAFLGPTYEELVGSEVEPGPERARDITPPTTAEQRRAAMAAAEVEVVDPATGEVVEVEVEPPPPPSPPKPRLTKAQAEAIRDAFLACGTTTAYFAVLREHAQVLNDLQASNGNAWRIMDGVMIAVRDRLGMNLLPEEQDDPMAELDDLDVLPPEEETTGTLL